MVLGNAEFGAERGTGTGFWLDRASPAQGAFSPVVISATVAPTRGRAVRSGSTAGRVDCLRLPVTRRGPRRDSDSCHHSSPEPGEAPHHRNGGTRASLLRTDVSIDLRAQNMTRPHSSTDALDPRRRYDTGIWATRRSAGDGEGGATQPEPKPSEGEPPHPAERRHAVSLGEPLMPLESLSIDELQRELDRRQGELKRLVSRRDRLARQ